MTVEQVHQPSEAGAEADVTNPPRGGPTRWRTREVDQARALIAHVMHYRVTLNPLSDAACFAMDMRGMQLGPVNTNIVTYGLHTLLETDGLTAGYHINFATTGGLVQSRHGETFASQASGGRVPVFEPTGKATVEMVDSAEALSLGFDRQAVESALEEHLDHSVRPLRFPGALDPTDGEGRTLASLARVLEHEVRAPTGVLEQPIVASKLADALLTTMLYATPHQYREELDKPAARTCPRPVKRAVDAMQADPAHPFTVRELARLAGVSPRALQAGFKQHLETTPMAYLRSLRLEYAHRDLTHPDSVVTVTDVALRWGFTHLGRFASAYRARYGALPSHALRR